ncbi:hypothetical protein [Salmon gill poxvirus]|nr:hypothetical protein [Salmon gill poxvirus]
MFSEETFQDKKARLSVSLCFQPTGNFHSYGKDVFSDTDKNPTFLVDESRFEIYHQASSYYGSVHYVKERLMICVHYESGKVLLLYGVTVTESTDDFMIGKFLDVDTFDLEFRIRGVRELTGKQCSFMVYLSKERIRTFCVYDLCE